LVLNSSQREDKQGSRGERIDAPKRHERSESYLAEQQDADLFFDSISGRRFSPISPSNYLKNDHFLRLEIVQYQNDLAHFKKKPFFFKNRPETVLELISKSSF
jgi:hypothetical protein